MKCLTPLLLILALFLIAAPCVLAFAPADLNQDGVVDATDMGIFFHAWKDYRANVALTGFELNADVYPVGSPDGKIDHNDFSVFLDSFLGSFKPSINLADYLAYNIGDQRCWVDSGGIFHWQDNVAALAGQPTGFTEKHIPITPAGEVDDQWLVSGGTITAYGTMVGGVAYTYSTPMALPAKLVQGTPVELSSDLSPSGHIDMTLTLLDVNKTVTMVGAAHTWTATCAKVEIVKDGTVGGTAYHDDRIEWLAPGMGPVEEDTDPASPGTQIMTLQYLKVGTTTYGTLPTATTAGLYPMAQGNMHIFQSTDNTFGQKILAPKTVGTQSCGVQADFSLPDGDSAQYFTLAGGSASGFAGFKLSHDDYDYVFSPAVAFGTTWTMGSAIIGSGSVSYNGNASYGTYSAVVCPVGFEQTVAAAGTTFSHCVVFDFHLSATQTGQPSPFWTMDTRVWLAPNVGPVQVADLSTVATPSSVRAAAAKGQVRTADAGVSGVKQAVYIKSGSSTYGTQPSVDWGAAMKLATGNAWGLAQSGDSDPHVFAVEAPETLGSVTGTIPLTAMQGGSGSYPNVASIESDHYYVSASQVELVGHTNDPDDNGYPLTMVGASPMAFPRTLTMGDSFVTAWTTVKDASTGLPVQVNGQTMQMRMTVSLVGNGTSHNTILGTDFTGCNTVQRYLETSVSGSAPELDIYVYDANAGMAEYHTVKTGNGNSDWYLKWARVGANTWGGAENGSHDPAVTLPIATGNDWRLGPTSPSIDYDTWSVGVSGSAPGYASGVYPVTRAQDAADPKPNVGRYVTEAAARLLLGIDFYTSAGAGPYPAWFAPAFSEPRPWPIGLVVRTNMTAAVGAPVNQNYQYLMVRVPVDFGLTVVTPAGTFNNCVAAAELQQFALAGTTTAWTWKHFYTVYAPGVGPVEYWERKGVQGGTIESSYSKYGLLQYADVGGTHIGP